MRWPILIAAAAAVFALAADLSDAPPAQAVLHKLSGHAVAATHHASAACTPGGIIAGALRNDGAGWYAISDADHAPLNVAAVETDTMGITIIFSARATTLHTFIVAPDETLARAGISAGASVGMDRATIHMSRAGYLGTHRVSPRAITTASHPLSNLWVYGVTAMSCHHDTAL